MKDRIAKAQEAFPMLDFRDGWSEQGIAVIKPKMAKPKGGVMTEDGPMAQSQIISENLEELVQILGVKTVVWDTVTATARHVLNEFALAESKSAKTKKYEVRGEDGVLAQAVQPSLPQYGMMQSHMRENVRNPQVLYPIGAHLFHIMHQETSTKSGGRVDGETIRIPVMHGPNGGGPSSVDAWGTEYRQVSRIYTEGDKRFWQLQQFTDKNGVPYAARTNSGAGDIPLKKQIPSGYKGCKDLWAWCLSKMGIDPMNPEKGGYYSGTLYGVQSVGKTFFAMSVLGIEGMLPALLIAADGGSEYLGSCPDELKGVTEPTSQSAS